MTMVVPYKESKGSKKEQVETMFDNISHRYDFLNHFLSLGIDKSWRKKAIRLVGEKKGGAVLDVATGTGDFAIEAMKLNPNEVVGVDISEGMLEIGRRKMKKNDLASKISMIKGDSENLPFEENKFDVITVGFGVRNFENLEKGLSEMLRVMKTDGKVAILEFSRPNSFPVKQIYNLYFTKVLPWLGKLISKDKAAYTYLPESVNSFPEGQEFCSIMEKVGYRNIGQHRLMTGIATIYVAEK